MRKNFKRAVALTCVAICASATFAGCKPGQGLLGNLGGQVGDKNKTQLYIGNFDGGYGSRWLEEYKTGFEAKYKDVSFESGKTGVEVQIIPDKERFRSTNLKSTIDKSNVDIVFTELLDYYDYLEDGLLMDITDIVKGTIDGENKSIEDKLTDAQKNYYTSYSSDTVQKGKYFALPHFQSLRGIIYDKDLFNDLGLYIKADGTVNGREGDADLSAGPDGVKPSYDDGLPATYDQFFNWCNTLATEKQVTPFCWTGAHVEDYMKYLYQALLVDTQGLEAGQYMYSQADKEVDVKVIKSFNGDTPVVTTQKVSRVNAKDMKYSAAAYYMYDFIDRLVSNPLYYDADSFSQLQTHETAQFTFLESKFNPNKQPIAMLIDGAWWEEEANMAFESLSEYPNSGRYERNFGFMPMPKPTEAFIGKPTLADANDSIMIVNAKCTETDMKVVEKFIQYITTDANLQLFNSITSVPRDYTYELTSAQKENLSSFAKSLAEIRENATGIVYARTMDYNDYHNNRVNHTSVSYFNTDFTADKHITGTPVSVFRNNAVTAKQYFDGIQ